MDKWSDEQVQILKDAIANKQTYVSLELILGKSSGAIAAKAKRLGISSRGARRKWDLTKDQVINLIREHKSGILFDTDKSLPCRKTCMSILGVNTWNECMALAQIEKLDALEKSQSLGTFYVIQLVDLNGTKFKKFGITNGSVKTRHIGRDYEILVEISLPMSEARKLESFYKTQVNLYTPKETFTGFTECYT